MSGRAGPLLRGAPDAALIAGGAAAAVATPQVLRVLCSGSLGPNASRAGVPS